MRAKNLIQSSHLIQQNLLAPGVEIEVYSHIFLRGDNNTAFFYQNLLENLNVGLENFLMGTKTFSIHQYQNNPGPPPSTPLYTQSLKSQKHFKRY